MKNKTAIGIMLTLLLTGIATLTFNIQPVKSDYTWTETIYIRADGSVEPADAPISTLDYVTYMWTDNIVDAAPSWFDIAIIVERDNIVLDGAGHTLQGTHADYSKGISLEGRSNVIIKNTNTKGFKHGIYLKYTSYIIVSGNNITANGGNGIALEVSSYNIISGNNITGNDVSGSGIGLYGLLGTTKNNVISANNIIKSYYGIYLDYSSTNNISENNVTGNECGIGLLEFSNNNVISRNNITDNEYGITLGYSSTNSIFGNNIKRNSKGIHIWNNSSDNIVYHNNFINNTNQVISKNLVNVWDDGYLGNYWSEYNGTDANGDGIGDAPYIIDANNTDTYPLMHPWGPLPVHNINTGLGYATIQEAINANETLNGHTIFVESGTYYENVIINKTLLLIGENRETTIIDGKRTGIVVLVTASNVTVSGFTIKDAGMGMRIESDSNKIENNAITDNGCGISIFFSNDNALRDNNITDNFLNFGVEGYSLTNFIHNIDSTNTVDGKPIHYLINKTNLIIDGSAFSEIGYLAIINSTNVTVSRLHLSKNVQGLLFAYTKNSIIRDMNISENSVGIYLVNSENNSIYNNVVTANYHGFYIEHSNNNTVYHNNVLQNLLAQVLSFYSTNTWDNSYPSGGNFWSNYAGMDRKSGPNQDQPGSDGIGDTPYTIDLNNIDRYPLAAPFSMFEAGTWDGISYKVYVISNSTVSDFYFNPDEGAFVRFNVTGDSGTRGFCRVTIPKDLLWVEDGWTIMVGDDLITDYTNVTDEDSTYLYFTYNHSTNTVVIQGTHVIPEFPPSLILPLFIITTLLAAIFCRRKQKSKLETF